MFISTASLAYSLTAFVPLLLLPSVNASPVAESGSISKAAQQCAKLGQSLLYLQIKSGGGKFDGSYLGVTSDMGTITLNNTVAEATAFYIDTDEYMHYNGTIGEPGADVKLSLDAVPHPMDSGSRIIQFVNFAHYMPVHNEIASSCSWLPTIRNHGAFYDVVLIDNLAPATLFLAPNNTGNAPVNVAAVPVASASG